MSHSDISKAFPFFQSDRKFTLEDLENLASYRIIRRGLNYARSGRVIDMAASPTRLEARVLGTDSEPYLVEFSHDGQGLISSCNCPFDWETVCKHGVAVLATFFNQVGSEMKPSAALSNLEKEEKAVRRKRAESKDFRVRKIEGGRFLGRYLVQTPADKSYDVEIRSLGETVNRCSCPDYATSMLGTCKHIEAVLLSLRKRAKRKFATARSQPPEIGQVLADYSDTPRIRLMMPANPTPALKDLTLQFFDNAGFFFQDPVADFPVFLKQARRLRKLIIFDDAVELSETMRAERQARDRREEVHRDILHGGYRPGGILADLYPFQLSGTAFLAATGRALLGDEMGLGKTIQAIAAAGVLTERGEINRTLIVCPASLKAQWAQEIQRFTGLESQIISGFPAKRLSQYRQGRAFTIINYELAMRDQKGISELAPDLLVLDEAQRIRNWRTKTAAAIKEIKSRFAFVLTGTPLQNRLDDLYSIMQVVDRRLLGPLWAYNEKFVVRSEKGNRIDGYRNLDELRRRLAPRLLRRTLSEVKLQLPERIDSRFGVDMTVPQRSFMEEGVTLAAMYANIAIRRPLTPEELQRMMMAMQMARMACNAAGLVDKESVGSPKLDEFEQVINDLCLGEGRKVVVFSEWVRFCGMAAERADKLGIGYVRLDGSVPTPRRGGLINRFRDDADCRIFFSTDAGGVGLNLQFANAMINLEMPWNPAVLDQRIGRIHRHGQTDPVHVFLLVAEDSFESSLETVLASKRGIFAAALDHNSDATEIDAPSSCLHVVQHALQDLRIEDADQITGGLDLQKEPAGEEASLNVPAAIIKSPEQRSQAMADVLGGRLHQIIMLPSGQVVALVDKLDDVATEAAKNNDMTIAESTLVKSMTVLGEDSPFASGRILWDQVADSSSGEGVQRDRWLQIANRKLKAARMLAASELGAEALANASAGLLATACSAAGALEIDEQMAASQLLFEILVPQEILNLEQAAIISRAEGLAQSYANATQSVPESTMQMVLEDAEKFLEWAGRR